MVRNTGDAWLHRFAWGLAIATLGLIALGGVVTTKGVGMAVPDWPRTYGDHMFLFPPSKWMAGIFYEHSHRLWASLVGLFCSVFAIWTWSRGTSGRRRWMGIAAMVVVVALLGVRHQPGLFVGMGVLSAIAIIWAGFRAVRDSDRLRWLGVIALAAVIIQGVLGGLRVILDTHGWGKEFGIFHATLAQLFFLLVVSLLVLTSKWWSAQPSLPSISSSFRWAVLAISSVILLQLLFGATMRHQHAGLAVPDLPFAYGKLWPATDPASIAAYNQHRLEAAGENPITAFHIAVHMLHRFTGVLLLVGILSVTAFAWRLGGIFRALTLAWSALALVQVTLGILSILSQRKVDVTTAHVAVGALTFAIGWLLVMIASRARVSAGKSAKGALLSGDIQWKHV